MNLLQPRLLFTCASILCAGAMTGCLSEDPSVIDVRESLRAAEAEIAQLKSGGSGASEEVMALKADLTAAELKLEALHEQLNEAQKSGGSSGSQASGRSGVRIISGEDLEDSYIGAARKLREDIDSGGIEGYGFETCTLHKVEVPDTLPDPYRSKVSISLREQASGKKIALEFPVSADLAGKWKFPDLAQVSQDISGTAEEVAQPADLEVAPASDNPKPPSGRGTAVQVGTSDSGALPPELRGSQPKPKEPARAVELTGEKRPPSKSIQVGGPGGKGLPSDVRVVDWGDGNDPENPGKPAAPGSGNGLKSNRASFKPTSTGEILVDWGD